MKKIIISILDRLSFLQKILLLQGVPMLLLAFGIAFATWFFMEQAKQKMGFESQAILKAQIETFLEKLVQERSDSLDQELNHTQTDIYSNALLLKEKFLELRDSEIVELMATLHGKIRHCSNIYYISADGGTFYAYPKPPQSEAVNLLEKPFFPKLDDFQAGKILWSSVHENPLDMNYDLVIDVIAPVPLSHGIQGYTGISISVTRLISQYNQQQPIRGSYTFIMDTDYQLVGAPPHARIELSSQADYIPRGIINLSHSGRPALDHLIQKMAMGESGIQEIEINNEPKYMAYHPLRTVNWRLGIVVPVRMATSASEQLVTVVQDGASRVLQGMLFWSVGLLIFSLIMGILVAGLLTSPIRKMCAVANSLGRGNLGERVIFTGKDEMKILADTFNSMAYSLQTMVSDLHVKNTALKSEISERKRTARKLQESEKKYRVLVETMSEGMTFLDPNAVLTYVNSRFCEMLGYDTHDLIGNSVFGFLDEANREILKHQLELRRKGYFDAYEMAWTRKDGSKITTIMSPRPIVDDTGNFIGSFSVITDISIRKQMEIELAEEKERLTATLQEMNRMRLFLKNIVDSMPSMLIGVDTDGCVTQWNLEAEKITGISKDDAEGKPFTSLFDKLEGQISLIRQAISEKTTKTLEKVAVNTNGNVHYLNVMVYPLITNGVEGAVIRVDDVTSRVRIEEMMIQTEKMMSVGGLAAGMAHEINNPLAGILQSVQNISRRISHGLPINEEIARECGITLDGIQSYMEQRRIFQFLDGIRQSGERASRIVANMLNFSRPGSSKISFVNLTSLIEKTVELASHDYNLKKKYDFRTIHVIRDFDSDIPDVPCIETEIEQVLLNVLSNAAQALTAYRFNNENAHSLLQNEEAYIPRIILRLKNQGDRARIEIEDNGPGMDENTRKRVFEPFFTTKDVGVGTGLGLSVSYFIITSNHHGTISVESEPGKGARFIICLPLG